MYVVVRSPPPVGWSRPETFGRCRRRRQGHDGPGSGSHADPGPVLGRSRGAASCAGRPLRAPPGPRLQHGLPGARLRLRGAGRRAGGLPPDRGPDQGLPRGREPDVVGLPDDGEPRDRLAPTPGAPPRASAHGAGRGGRPRGLRPGPRRRRAARGPERSSPSRPSASGASTRPSRASRRSCAPWWCSATSRTSPTTTWRRCSRRASARSRAASTARTPPSRACSARARARRGRRPRTRDSPPPRPPPKRRVSPPSDASGRPVRAQRPAPHVRQPAEHR